jgi:aminomethyltransferase
MIANRGDHLLLVVNAARKQDDLALLKAGLSGSCTVELLDNALVALQGPLAAAVLSGMHPDVGLMRFMDVREIDFQSVRAVVSRSGYTGEDGFEISLPARSARDFFERLVGDARVLPIGLGARDSLRLEAGLCLHGHDIDAETTVVEAALEWAIQPARRSGGARPGGFPGADVILAQIAEGAERRRVGLRPEGRAPMREGTLLFAAEEDEKPVGRLTSGGFGPSLGAPVAMGYVPIELAAAGTRLWAELRGRRLPIMVTKLPFIQPGYKRG